MGGGLGQSKRAMEKNNTAGQDADPQGPRLRPNPGICRGLGSCLPGRAPGARALTLRDSGRGGQGWLHLPERLPQDAAARGSPGLRGGDGCWDPARRLRHLLLGLRPHRAPAPPPVLWSHLLPGVRAAAGRASPRAALDPLPAVSPEHTHTPGRGGHAGPRPGRLPGHQGRAGAVSHGAAAPGAPQRQHRCHSAASWTLPHLGPPASLPPAQMLLLGPPRQPRGLSSGCCSTWGQAACLPGDLWLRLSLPRTAWGRSIPGANPQGRPRPTA